MSNFLDRFREKPEHERKIVAVVAAAIITLVIFIVWITALGVNDNNDVVQEATEEADAPFEGVWDAVTTMFSDLGDQYKQIQESLLEQASSTSEMAEPVATTSVEQAELTPKEGTSTPSIQGENMVE